MVELESIPQLQSKSFFFFSLAFSQIVSNELRQPKWKYLQESRKIKRQLELREVNISKENEEKMRVTFLSIKSTQNLARALP